MQVSDHVGFGASCGLQVCSHPTCWGKQRQLARELYRLKKSPPKKRTRLAKQRQQSAKAKEDEIDGLPILSILNMLDDYGGSYDSGEQFTTSSQSNEAFVVADTMRNIPPEGSHIITKLQLQSLTQESASGITPAPANTPLQSSHGFGDTPCSTEIHQVQYVASKRGKQHLYRNSCNIVNMNLPHQHQQKKFFVWQSNRSRKDIHQPRPVTHHERNKKAATSLLLPIEVIPNTYTESSWPVGKGKKTKPTQLNQDALRKHIDATSSEAISKKEIGTTAGTSSKTPHEIEQLRNVPLDVLMRVVKMAISNGVLTTKQASLLLQQVTGRKYNLPPIKANKAVCSEDTTMLLKTKNMKISDKKTSLGKYSNTSSVSAVYKLDQKQLNIEGIRPPPKDVVAHNTDMFLDEAMAPQFRQSANRQISAMKHKALPNISIPCVSNASQADVIHQSPPRPFHYLRDSRDMSLRPLPTPPPPSPSTERDSQYDEILGGSTVVVNASNTPTLTTHHQPPSCGTPTSWTQGEYTKQTDDQNAGTSSESTVVSHWPKVDENDFVVKETLSICEEPVSEKSVPKNTQEVEVEESKETEAPNEVLVADGDVHSPAPPPPSPELPLDYPGEDLAAGDERDAVDMATGNNETSAEVDLRQNPEGFTPE